MTPHPPSYLGHPLPWGEGGPAVRDRVRGLLFKTDPRLASRPFCSFENTAGVVLRASPQELQGKLPLPMIRRQNHAPSTSGLSLLNGPKGRTVDDRTVRQREAHLVEGIEEFRTELELVPFFERRSLEDSEIGAAESRPTQDVSSRSPITAPARST